MSSIPKSIFDEVVLRARNRCEYCQLSQVGQEATFHIDHVIPRVAGGMTDIDNLALACVSCSLRKGARQSAEDPGSNETVPLFNPREQSWDDHFRWNEEWLVPLTPTGRATESLLAMNRPIIVAIRREEMVRGRHPPSK